MKIVSAFFVAILLSAAWSLASAQQPRVHIPKSGSANVAPRARVASPQAALPAPSAQAAPIIENGRRCTTIDFEGVGNLAAIPAFDGISSPGWLGIIDADAGGTGNIAQEPSPQTTAFWLGGNPASRDIVMTNPASKVEFFYASAVSVTLQALDDEGNLLATAVGGGNFGAGTGDPTGNFNRWDALTVETQGNKIKTLRVSGNSNQTTIDNLKVCTSIGIAAVEMTQVIQQYQDLKDLKTSLTARREPPVPVVAGKPGVLRIYMERVGGVTDVTVKLTGVVSQTKALSLQPQCSPEQQRRQVNGCRSIDFYFTPPEGNWDITVDVLDGNGNVVEKHNLPFKSRKTKTLALKAVSICDATDAGGNWLCAPANALTNDLSLLRKIAPTNSVTAQVTNSVVRRDVASFADIGDWWPAAISDVNNLYGLFDTLSDLPGNRRTTYYGMIRPELPGGTGGMAHGIPGRAAGSRTSAIRLGVETASEVVAHEVGHTLGLKHTNTEAPITVASPPGCYSLAADSTTNWAFADNRIQSAARLEVGFDVGAQRPLLPENTFEVMSYCVPRWISPQRYKTALTTLGGGSVSTVSATSLAHSLKPIAGMTAQQALVFWTVSGSIVADEVLFDPLFNDVSQGSTDEGSGTHRIEVQNAAGDVLFSRFFTPSTPSSESETLDDEIEGPPSFFELIPVTAGAARIVVFNPANSVIGTLVLQGVKPTVVFSPPLFGTLSGSIDIGWNIVDSDSGNHTARIFYSPDNGITWSQIGNVSDSNSLLVDFDVLPGSNGAALVRISVSDGVNTGSVTSSPFSVTKKIPSDARIISPQANRAFPLESMIEFEASAYDVDDGVLDGAAVTWESSLDGLLGNGAYLALNSLHTGTHSITMRATDNDGNEATATTTIRVAGAAPTLDLVVTPLDALPTTCVEATVNPKPELRSVPLAVAEYSLDGGTSWTNIPLNRLPFKFIVPNSGFIHLIARAYDEAGQSIARDAKFFIDSPCFESGIPRLGGTIVSKGTSTPGVMFVDLSIKNTGKGLAKEIRINKAMFRTLAGTGTVTLNTTLSPAFPITLPNLTVGQSTTVRLFLNIPSKVTRFGITQDGSIQDTFGRPFQFSSTQAVMR